MVLCAVVGCSNRSEDKKRRKKDGKKVSFFRIPAVIRHTDNRDLELSTRRRDGYLAVISRDDLTAEMMENSDYRVCSDHFVTGEPAKLYKFTSPNWLPTLNLGHTKRNNNADYTRYEWAIFKTTRSHTSAGYYPFYFRFMAVASPCRFRYISTLGV